MDVFFEDALVGFSKLEAKTESDRFHGLLRAKSALERDKH